MAVETEFSTGQRIDFWGESAVAAVAKLLVYANPNQTPVEAIAQCGDNYTVIDTDVPVCGTPKFLGSIVVNT